MKKSDFRGNQFLLIMIFSFWIVATNFKEQLINYGHIYGYNFYQFAFAYTLVIVIIMIVLGSSIPISNKRKADLEDIQLFLSATLLFWTGAIISNELFGYNAYDLALVFTIFAIFMIILFIVKGSPYRDEVISSTSCKGAVPELAAGYPKAEDNYKIGKKDLNKNILKNIGTLVYDGINTWFGVVNEKFIDADISAKVIHSHCVSMVECQIWDVRNKTYLNPLPLTYDSLEDIFKGTYIYQEKISYEDAEGEGKKKVRNRLLKKLEKIAKKKGWKGVAKLLKKSHPILAVIPNIPPELVIDRVDITDISGATHPYSLEEKVDIPTYLPEKIEDIVFGLNSVN